MNIGNRLLFGDKISFTFFTASTRVLTMMIFDYDKRICMEKLKPYQNNHLNLHLKDKIHILYRICLIKMNPFNIKCPNTNIL